MEYLIKCPSCGEEFASWIEVELFKTVETEGFCPYCGCGFKAVVRVVPKVIVVSCECAKTRLSERARYQRL